MNIYFIVEGKRTEKKIYPAWLNHLIPQLERVTSAYDVENNNYYLFSGNGFPALLHNHLRNSIEEVNEISNYQYIVIILDVDEETIENRINEVNEFIIENDIVLKNVELVIIPQNRCIETWFLGNRKIYKSNPESNELSSYVRFFNVKENDPESMGIFRGFHTHAQFHTDYCIEFLKERNIRYSKTRPNGVIDPDYLVSLIEREKETSHLQSFKLFIDFIEKIKSEL